MQVHAVRSHEAAAPAIAVPSLTTMTSGHTARGVKLSYRTYGILSPARDNAALYSMSYSAQRIDTQRLIEPEGILDPQR